MFYYLTRLALSLRSPTGAAPTNLANALMEGADQSAGNDPHRAHELRQAASAFLRVVR